MYYHKVNFTINENYCQEKYVGDKKIGKVKNISINVEIYHKTTYNRKVILKVKNINRT